MGRTNVRFHLAGVKHLHHPIVGDLHLDFERLDIRADTGLTLFTHTADPGSKSEHALDLLASWSTTTLDQEMDATKNAGCAAPGNMFRGLRIENSLVERNSANPM